jgi:hypothetical protein
MVWSRSLLHGKKGKEFFFIFVKIKDTHRGKTLFEENSNHSAMTP